MEKLNFPTYNFKLKKNNNKTYIFDEIRKKWIFLSPEEWVRQNIISFLQKDPKVPVSHIAVEKGFKVKGLSKRFDIVVFDKKGNIIILIECKSPKIKLNQKSIDQLVIYNLELNASYLMLSNGLKHIFIKYQNGNFEIIDDIPVYSKL